MQLLISSADYDHMLVERNENIRRQSRKRRSRIIPSETETMLFDQQIICFEGLKKVEVEEAEIGEIIAYPVQTLQYRATICSADKIEPFPC